MRTQNLAAIALAAAGLVWANAAEANNVFLDFDKTNILTEEGVGFARYRLNATNWDQAVGNDGPFAVSESSNLGNVAALNGVEWAFTLSYTAGTGYSFTLDDGTTSSTDSWTSGIGSGGSLLPTQSFNAIGLQVAAGGFKAGNTGWVASMFATDLAFSGAGLTTVGSLSDMSVVDAGSSTSEFQYLVSDVDLSTVNWTLTGKVEGTYTCTIVTCTPTIPTFSDEGFKFNIGTKQVTYTTPVPVPAALPIIGAALAGFGVAGFRQRKAAA